MSGMGPVYPRQMTPVEGCHRCQADSIPWLPKVRLSSLRGWQTGCSSEELADCGTSEGVAVVLWKSEAGNEPILAPATLPCSGQSVQPGSVWNLD